MFFALWFTSAVLNAPSLSAMNILIILTDLSVNNTAWFPVCCKFYSQKTVFSDIWLSHHTALFLDFMKEEAAPNLRHGII